jgi:hypothetical protein
MQNPDIRAMIQGVNRRSLTGEAGFDDGFFHARFVVDQVALGQLNTSVSLCQNISTGAPYSYASCYYYQKVKWGSLKTIKQINFFRTGGTLERKGGSRCFPLRIQSVKYSLLLTCQQNWPNHNLWRVMRIKCRCFGATMKQYTHCFCCRNV